MTSLPSSRWLDFGWSGRAALPRWLALSLIALLAAPAPAAETDGGTPTPAPTAETDGGAPAAALEAEDVSLEAVVVSATKTSLATSEAPAAVSVVTSASLEDRNVSRLGDALSRVPSMYFFGSSMGYSSGSSGGSGLSLRGVDTKRTLILIDGQPIQDATSGSVNWRIPHMEDVERIEVVPGAFSSLYGSSAVGGVVNILTKQPSRRERTFKVKNGWGDANGVDVSAYVRERFDSGLGVAAGVTYGTHGGYANDYVVRAPVDGGVADTPVTGAIPTTTNTGAPAFIVGDKGATPWTQLNATAKVTYELAPGHRLAGGVAYSTMDSSSTYFRTYLRDGNGAPVASGKTLDVEGQSISLSESNFVNSSPIHEASTRLFATYEGLFFERLVVKVDAAHIGREYAYSTVGPTATYASGPGEVTELPNGAFDGTVTASFPIGAYNYLVTGFAAHAESAARRVHGLSAWRDQSTRTSLKNGYDGQSQTFSLFAQDELSLPVLSLLKLYLGARVDRWDTSGVWFQNTAPVTETSYPRRGEWAFSPKLSAVFKPIESVTVRGSVGRSFRAPNNLDLYSTSVFASGTSPTGYMVSMADPTLSPERATSWEAGAAWRPGAFGLDLGATYFETYLSNLIASKTIVERALSQRINAGAARVRGVELIASAQPLRWLGLTASYTWLDSRITQNDGDPASVGKRLANSPEHLINAAVDVHWRRFIGTVSFRRVSHVYNSSQNADRVEGVPGSYDATAMVDAKVGVELLEGTRLSVAVNNLLDQRVFSYSLLPRRNVTAELVASF